MLNDPSLFLEWILHARSFAVLFPVGADADTAMDVRDTAGSEETWMEMDAAVQRLLRTTVVSEQARERIEKVAEAAFRMAWNASAGHHDLAAQASDDMRLLAEASLVGYRSPVLERMWTVYATGGFPADLDRRLDSPTFEGSES